MSSHKFPSWGAITYGGRLRHRKHGFLYVREILKLRLRSALTSSEAETLKMRD
ncbi:hypothetical protein [Nostoc sp.]|uniref:hypothetical protein n=1 Tax=Nostoc sp. TaxID=1180 RepID=UPI002FF50403